MFPVPTGWTSLAAMVATAATVFAWTPLERIWGRLVALLQSWVANFNIPLLKYYSLLIETKLRQAGNQLFSEHLAWVLIGISLVVGVTALLMVWRVLGSGHRIRTASFRQIEPASTPLQTSWQAATGSYFKSVVDLAYEGMLLVCAATVLTMVAFMMGKLSWYSYLVTPVGRLYPLYFPQRAHVMNAVLGQDLFLFPIVITGLAMVVGLGVAAMCRLLHITRYAYDSRGLVGRIILFALPLTAIVAVFTQAAFALPHWGAGFAASLLPSLLVFAFCFKATIHLLPEIGMAASIWKSETPVPAQVLFLHNRRAEGQIAVFDPLQARLTGRRFPVDESVVMQGQLLERRGHHYILYRYGHDLFFQVNDRELQLRQPMTAQLRQSGRFRRRFELYDGETRLFCLRWLSVPLLSPAKATMAFFEAMHALLQDPAAFEQAYASQWEGEEQ